MTAVNHGPSPSSVLPFAIVDTLVIDNQKATAAGFPVDICGLVLGGFRSHRAGTLRANLHGTCALIGSVNSSGDLSGAVIALADIDKLQAALDDLRAWLLECEQRQGMVQ